MEVGLVTWPLTGVVAMAFMFAASLLLIRSLWYLDHKDDE